VTSAGEDVYLSVLVPSLFTPWAELLVDALDPAPGSTAVDVATGPGTVARVIARRVGAIGHVYGCDLSAATLQTNRQGFGFLTQFGQVHGPCHTPADTIMTRRENDLHAA